MANDVTARVEQIVSSTVRSMKGFDIPLSADVSLIETGILDSLSIVTVVQQLQDAFGIDVQVADITLDNFDTLDLIARFVQERIA
jgi:acyl carrier protein